MGWLRFVAARCGQLLAVPISRYSCPGMGFRDTCLPPPVFRHRKGAFYLESGNPDIVRLAGRTCRLGYLLVWRLVN
ncbi:hypothetical protein EXE50_09755 [Halorubrum sp. ARQ200]|nr:hypothetical protein EXE50_09755 [Halorubrum sp. ARQ200]